MASFRVEGIVIKRRDLGEADKIVTLYTLERGKISVKVKGLRRISSRRSGTLELFHHVRAYIVPGKAGMDVLTEVELLESSFTWRRYLGRITVAYQLCELLDKLTPEQIPQPELYVFICDCLSRIPDLSADWQAQLQSWLVSIVKLLGYWPDEKKFTGDIYSFIEQLTEKPFNSPKLLKKLSK